MQLLLVLAAIQRAIDVPEDGRWRSLLDSPELGELVGDRLVDELQLAVPLVNELSFGMWLQRS